MNATIATHLPARPARAPAPANKILPPYRAFSYHVGAVSMIFLVFVSTSAMMIMACTMTCRCWLDSDPEKQAMMMVLTGSPMVR